MAIEDALVLAKSLRDMPSIPTAFAAYEQTRRTRVERVVAWGARSGSNKAPGAIGRVMRDLMLPLLFRLVISEKSLRWMYDYRVRWDERARSAAASAA